MCPKDNANLVEVYVYQLLTDRSDLTGDQQLKDSGDLYLDPRRRATLKVILDSWRAPSGFLIIYIGSCAIIPVRFAPGLFDF